MKVLVDAARLRVGGGIQVGVEQVRFLEASPDLDCVWRLSSALKSQLNQGGYSLPSRYHDATSGHLGDVLQFRSLMRSERPDVVFTVFGPPWVSAGHTPHVSGFARGWAINPDSIAWDHLSSRQRLRHRLQCRGVVRMMLRNAAYYWVETEFARRALLDETGLPGEHIVVAGNTCADTFKTWKSTTSKSGGVERVSADEVLLLTVSHWYPHKNLDLIPEVAELLRRQLGRPFRFLLTLDEDSDGWRQLAAQATELGVLENIQAIGVRALDELPALYNCVDAMFLPTLLETFSASYPEAMQMSCPILTSDLGFARDICGEAALYFEPSDASSAAAQVLHLLGSAGVHQHLVEKGLARVATFPTSEQRAAVIMDLLRRAGSRA